MLPLLHMKDDIRIVHLEMLGDTQWLSMKDLFKRRARCTPDQLTVFNQLECPPQGRPKHCFGRSQSPMKVNLSEHVITRLQVFLDREYSSRGDVNAIALLVDLKRIDDPFEIVQ